MYAAHVERQSRLRRAVAYVLICGDDSDEPDSDCQLGRFESVLLAVMFFRAASRRNRAKRVKFTRVTDEELLMRDDVSFCDQMRYKKSTVRVVASAAAGT